MTGEEANAEEEEDNWVEKFSIIAGKYTSLLSDVIKICKFIKHHSSKSR